MDYNKSLCTLLDYDKAKLYKTLTLVASQLVIDNIKNFLEENKEDKPGIEKYFLQNTGHFSSLEDYIVNLGNERRSILNLFSEAFCWRNTYEGYNFWCDINNRYIGFLIQLLIK